jgi:signal peptidase I
MQKMRASGRATRPGDVSSAGGAGGRASRRGRAASHSTVRSYAQSLAVAVLLALFFRQFVLQAFHIPSSSMENTLLIGDFLFVNKFLYGAQIPFTEWRLPAIRPPKAGDIIVFRSYDGRDFIKRCVAVAGDTIEVRAKELYVNGERRVESYTKHVTGSIYPPGGSPRDFYGPRVVGRDSIFMMGDNRDNSEDSRFWGPLAIGRVRGKAMFIYFSIDTTRGFLPPHLRLGRVGRIIH